MTGSPHVDGAVASPATHHHARRAALWTGLFLTPGAWIGDLLVRYFLIRWTSHHGVRWPLLASSCFSTVVLLCGAILCWRSLQRARGQAPSRHGKEGSGDTDSALAISGLVLAAYFFLLILAQAYPLLVLDAAEIT